MQRRQSYFSAKMSESYKLRPPFDHSAGILGIAVVIVDFNTHAETLNCLNSLLNRIPTNSKVYLIDNSDGESEVFEAALSALPLAIDYDYSGKNIGFASACNRGIYKAIDDGYSVGLLLNNDTIVESDILFRAPRILGNSQYAVLGIRNYYLSSPSVFWQGGKVWRPFKFGFKDVELCLDQEVTPCDYVAGSSLLFRLSVIRQVGPLDERYFAYYEEIDFCLRVKNNGFGVGIINDSRILHSVGLSSSSPIKAYLKTRNKLHFYQAHFDSRLRFLFIAGILILKDLALVLLQRHRLRNLRAIFYGIRDFVLGKLGRPPVHAL
jgi:GT2 family glycosyltransferase